MTKSDQIFCCIGMSFTSVKIWATAMTLYLKRNLKFIGRKEKCNRTLTWFLQFTSARLSSGYSQTDSSCHLLTRHFISLPYILLSVLQFISFSLRSFFLYLGNYFFFSFRSCPSCFFFKFISDNLPYFCITLFSVETLLRTVWFLRYYTLHFYWAVSNLTRFHHTTRVSPQSSRKQIL